MQAVACVDAFSAIDAGIVYLDVGRLDAGNAACCAVIAFGAIGRARSIIGYMECIPALEQPLPDTVQAGVIAQKIAYRSNVYEDKKNRKQVHDEHVRLPICPCSEKGPHIARSIEEHEGDKGQHHRGSQKACAENEPVDHLVSGGCDNHALPVHPDIGALSQKFTGQAVRPFRKQVLRTGPSAPDSAYGHIRDDGSGSGHKGQTDQEWEIRPPDLAPQGKEARGREIDPE